MYSDHYSTSINCRKKQQQQQKNILLQWQLNYGVWTDWFQKLPYCICSNAYVDYIMVFGLEQEDGRANNPISLAHPLHPIRSRWRKNAETWGLDHVFPPDDLSSGQHTQFIIIHIPCIIATSYFLSNWNNTYQEWVWPWRCVGWYDTLILSRLVSNVYFNYTVQTSVHHNMDISTMWHCASVICTPLYPIGIDLGCALFRSWVSFYWFLHRILFIMIVKTITRILMAILIYFKPHFQSFWN